VTKIVLLFMLYIAQGLPFGFQVIALPLVLREHGHSLTAIAFTSALSLPWFLKPLWAPFVDGYGASRRAWILPAQAGRSSPPRPGSRCRAWARASSIRRPRPASPRSSASSSS
jgi:hypothetical protein